MLWRIGRKLHREWDRWQCLPDQMVVLLTNPRSGGTRLSGALRGHPAPVIDARDFEAVYAAHHAVLARATGDATA